MMASGPGYYRNPVRSQIPAIRYGEDRQRDQEKSSTRFTDVCRLGGDDSPGERDTGRSQ